jgi:hypothetical protein
MDVYNLIVRSNYFVDEWSKYIKSAIKAIWWKAGFNISLVRYDERHVIWFPNDLHKNTWAIDKISQCSSTTMV